MPKKGTVTPTLFWPHLLVLVKRPVLVPKGLLPDSLVHHARFHACRVTNPHFPSFPRRSSIQKAKLVERNRTGSDGTVARDDPSPANHPSTYDDRMSIEDAVWSRALQAAPVMWASPVGAHTYAEDTDTDTTGETGDEPSVAAAPTTADGAKAGAEGVAGSSLFHDPRLNGYMSRLGMTTVYHRKSYFVGGCLQNNSKIPVTGLFVKEVVVDAGIHLLVWLGPLVAVVVLALQAQSIYARTSGVMVPHARVLVMSDIGTNQP